MDKTSLRFILDAHRTCRPGRSLGKNLGDGFLYEHNAVYKVIRDRALAAGFRFSSKDLFHYRVLPLAALPQILKCKTIIYSDNVSVLLKLERTHPGRFEFDEIPALAANHVFHESAHAVAHGLISQQAKLPEQNRALNLILQEAFANAVEMVGTLFVDSVTHEAFYNNNSYLQHNHQMKKSLHGIAGKHGVASLFTWVLLSYFYSNYLYDGISDAELRLLLRKFSFSVNRSQEKTFFSVFRNAFELDPRFRLFTMTFSLKHLGFKKGMDSLFGGSLLKIILRDDFVAENVKKLAVPFV